MHEEPQAKDNLLELRKKVLRVSKASVNGILSHHPTLLISTTIGHLKIVGGVEEDDAISRDQ